MPEPIMTGRFTLYETPEGGFHVAYLPEGDEETRHLEIPAMVVNLARSASQGKLNPLQALKGLVGHAST